MNEMPSMIWLSEPMVENIEQYKKIHADDTCYIKAAEAEYADGYDDGHKDGVIAADNRRSDKVGILVGALEEWKLARTGEINWERLANAEHGLVAALASYKEKK